MLVLPILIVWNLFQSYHANLKRNTIKNRMDMSCRYTLVCDKDENPYMKNKDNFFFTLRFVVIQSYTFNRAARLFVSPICGSVWLLIATSSFISASWWSAVCGIDIRLHVLQKVSSSPHNSTVAPYTLRNFFSKWQNPRFTLKINGKSWMWSLLHNNTSLLSLLKENDETTCLTYLLWRRICYRWPP